MSSDALVQSLATVSDALTASSMMSSMQLLSQNTLLGTEALLPRTYTGQRVGVAMIDSGVQSSPDIKVSIAYDFNDGVATLHANGDRDDYGHGTHVAGLISSTGKTSNGLYQGMAPGVTLISLRALDANGAGYTSDVIAAVNFAIANKTQLGIDVINLSLGHPIYEPAATDPLVQAVEQAVAAGIVVVTSAGNFGGDPVTHVSGYAGITSPGNAPDAITVGAIETYQTVARADDIVAWYSSRGPSWYDAFQKPDLVAPGSHLVSDVPANSTIATTYPGGLIGVHGPSELTKLSGTSMAAGVVTGAVALMIDASRAQHSNAVLTPNAIKAILQYTRSRCRTTIR